MEKMRKAGLLVWRILQELSGLVREGVTTFDLELTADRMISDAGARPAFKGYYVPAAGGKYPYVLCTSVNCEVVHGMPGVKCLIIGEGPLEQELKEQVSHLKLEASVKFVKMNGRPSELLPMFDVVATPSLQEGLGLSVMEAQACGVPVVASRVGGLVEAVKDGETGILVPPRDHLALADALMKILADKHLASRFGLAGREWIMKNFAVDQMVERTLAVYENVLKEKRGR